MHSCLAWPRVSSTEVSRELRLQCVQRMETRVLQGIIQFHHATWAGKTWLTPSLRPEVPIVRAFKRSAFADAMWTTQSQLGEAKVRLPSSSGRSPQHPPRPPSEARGGHRAAMRTTLFAEEVVVSLSKLQLRQLEAQRSRFLETCGKSDDSHATLVDLAQVTSVVGSDISADLCTLCFQIFDTNESGKIDWRRFLLGIVGIGGVFGPQNWTSQHTQFVFETFARQNHNGMRYNEFQTLICMTQGLDDELTRIGSGPEAQDACFFGDSVSATDIAKWLWRSGYTAHGKDGSLSLRQFRQATREYWHFGNLSRLLGDPLGVSHPHFSRIVALAQSSGESSSSLRRKRENLGHADFL